MVLAVVCKPICMNQAARTALLAIMPTLDDVEFTPVQRGNQSRGMVIPGADGLMESWVVTTRAVARQETVVASQQEVAW
jgi:hypothetical protein